MKKILLSFLILVTLSACASLYTFPIKYETDRRESLIQIAKASIDTYDYATKIYKYGYVKDYDLIVIITNNNLFFKEQILNDFRYYCEARDGYMEGYTKFKYTGSTGKSEFDFGRGTYGYDICFNQTTKLPIFAIRNLVDNLVDNSIDMGYCDIESGNQKLEPSLSNKISQKCLTTVMTEEYFNKLKQKELKRRGREDLEDKLLEPTKQNQN